MRVTVQLIRGHSNTLFERAAGDPVDEASWDPDESDEHASHTALNPSCARCVIATGDWKLVEPETRSELPEPAEE